MNKIPILIVEDDPTKPRALLDRLNETIFDVDVRNGPTEALDRVRNKRFQVVFIDLQLEKEEEGKEPIFDGIALGEKIRQIVPDIVMVMYSGSIQKGYESSSDHYGVCMDVLKADAVLSRADLFSMSSHVLSTRIRDWISARARHSADVRVQFEDGLRTDAAREVFGDEALKYLISTCAKGMTHFKVSALQAGYSGAAVLRVQAGHSPDYAAAVNLVVKISKSEFALADELQRRPRPGSHYDNMSVAPHRQEINERDGVYAIAIPEVRGMLLLREFLSVKGLAKGDQRILSRIVSDLLVPPARDARPFNVFGVPDSSYLLRATAASEIREFLVGALRWKQILNSSDFRALRATLDFVELVHRGTWCFTMIGRLAALLHGDFHCRNIFTAHNDGPRLIDFGRFEVYPRLFDFAALDTDLVLSVVDSSGGGDHDFKNISRWFSEVTQYYPYNNTAHGGATTKASWLRQRLLSEMVKELPAVLPAEYAEVLVFHFLRYLRFGNVSLARKILAARLIERLTTKFGLLP